MLNDDILGSNVRAALTSQPAPPADLQAIMQREPRTAQTSPMRRRLGALAAAAVLAVVVLPLVHPQALLAAVSSDVRIVLRALHLPAGPPVSTAVLSRIRTGTHATTVAEASREVPFKLVPPAGLPAGARQSTMYLMHPGTWSAKTHQWSVGAPLVLWKFTRSNGTTFRLQAAKYDPHGRYFAYMWQTVEDAHGNVVTVKGHPELIRHEAFFWRNGDQVMSAFTGDGIKREEIAAIRRAMSGTAIPTVRTKGPQGGRRLMLVKP